VGNDEHPRTRDRSFGPHERIRDFDFRAGRHILERDPHRSGRWRAARAGPSARRAARPSWSDPRSCGEEPGFAPFFRYGLRLANGEAIPAADQRTEVDARSATA
jgi:hypothetical protein